MRRKNWKRIQPTSLRQALELCKDHAREVRNLSVERIAERMGLADHWALYKWLQNGRMPAVLIPAYEDACGIDYVTRWLAAGRGKLLVTIPTGREASAADMQALQQVLNDVVGQLLRVYGGDLSGLDTAKAAISQAMAGMAYHDSNLDQLSNPELPLEQADDE